MSFGQERVAGDSSSENNDSEEEEEEETLAQAAAAAATTTKRHSQAINLYTDISYINSNIKGLSNSESYVKSFSLSSSLGFGSSSRGSN